MPISGDSLGRKTCLQVYNRAGFSIEFERVRGYPQRFDSVLSIVVWCGVPPLHHYLKSQLLPIGIFFARKVTGYRLCGLTTNVVGLAQRNPTRLHRSMQCRVTPTANPTYRAWFNFKCWQGSRVCSAGSRRVAASTTSNHQVFCISRTRLRLLRVSNL